MKLYNFYNGIEKIVNNAVKAGEVRIDNLFFIPEKKINIDGWCNAHRYGYNSKTGECYDLGITEVMPKINYTEFVFDFIPNGIHIAKIDRTTFKVDCSLYSSTEID